MNRKITLEPIAFVRNNRYEKVDDNWSEIIPEIELIDSIPMEIFQIKPL